MRSLFLFAFFGWSTAFLSAQTDSLPPITKSSDSTATLLNMDAAYNRPFLKFEKIPIAIGGYLEAHGEYAGTDGISEGLSFALPRMTVFLASSLHRRIKFLSEIEFEEGGKEINLEYASLDFEGHPLLNLRGGIILNPIGAFNQNHDGPRWDFVSRPVSATQMLPATWSNVGAGLYGKWYQRRWVFAYEAYLTNGFDDSIIANDEGHTFLPATKENRERFEESPNGVPLFTGKIAVRNRRVGEIGFSYMGGVFNKFREDGLVLDRKRRTDVLAIDANAHLPGLGTNIVGEWAWVYVDVPQVYAPQYGRRQQGGFLDVVQPFLRRSLLGFEHSVFHLALRLDYVDWQVGEFQNNGQPIGDELFALTTGLAWRPTGQTVVRLNYRYAWQWDFLGNPPARSAELQLGLASYF